MNRKNTSSQHENRIQVQHEINLHTRRKDANYPLRFKKTQEERMELKKGKHDWLKNPFKNESQDSLFSQIASYIVDPKERINFGGLTLIQVNHE